MMSFVNRLARRARRAFAPVETIEGYESPELVETVFQKTVRYVPEINPEFDGAEQVLDFGGACGIHFKQVRSKTVRWAVVETPAMVARAKALETERLQFFTGIAAAHAWLGNVDLMHSNGAVNYAPDPLNVVEELTSLQPTRLIWQRLFFDSELEQVSMLHENGPAVDVNTPWVQIKYKRNLLRERDFIKAHAGYRIASRTENSFSFERMA